MITAKISNKKVEVRFEKIECFTPIKEFVHSNFEAWVWKACRRRAGKALELEILAYLSDLPSPLHVDSSLSTAFSSSFVLYYLLPESVFVCHLSLIAKSCACGECFFFFLHHVLRSGSKKEKEGISLYSVSPFA